MSRLVDKNVSSASRAMDMDSPQIYGGITNPLPNLLDHVVYPIVIDIFRTYCDETNGFVVYDLGDTL